MSNISIAKGTLSDSAIIGLAEQGHLITSHFAKDNVKQACYELRASDIFWDTTLEQDKQRIQVGLNEYFVLRPNSFVTCIVMESINLPANIIGRVMTKGQLFSIGIAAVNTYADPGFSGRLGVTLYNASKRYIKITPGQPIAKIEFSVMPEAVSKTYTGQFSQNGYEKEFWPVPAHLYASSDDLKSLKIDPYDDNELLLVYGEPVHKLAQRVDWLAKRMWIYIMTYFLLFTMVVLLLDERTLFAAFIVGIVGNLISAGVLAVLARKPN